MFKHFFFKKFVFLVKIVQDDRHKCFVLKRIIQEKTNLLCHPMIIIIVVLNDINSKINILAESSVLALFMLIHMTMSA